MEAKEIAESLDLEDYRNAPSGVGAMAPTWADKPHRLVYDLVAYSYYLRAEGDALKAQISDLTQKLAQARERYADIVEHSYREFDGYGNDPRLDACRSTLAAIIRSDLG